MLTKNCSNSPYINQTFPTILLLTETVTTPLISIKLLQNTYINQTGSILSQPNIADQFYSIDLAYIISSGLIFAEETASSNNSCEQKLPSSFITHVINITTFLR